MVATTDSKVACNLKDDDNLTQLRAGIRNIFQDAFAAAASDARNMIGSAKPFTNETAELFGKYSNTLEKTIFESTAGCRERRREYAVLAKSLASLLRRVVGPHPDDIAALRILR